MLLSTSLLASALALVPSCIAASPEDWRSRSIYQVLTDRFALANGDTTASCDTSVGKYCGGTWNGIRNKLDYIQNMGFDAVWISPITKNLEGTTRYGDAYHGYWQTDLFSVNSHFGTPQDLKALSAALHARGMYLMVDIVVNHNGWNGDANSTDYSSFKPFNKVSQYHTPPCGIDYTKYDSDIDAITDCWVATNGVALPDLRTENRDVRTGYNNWIGGLINDYGIDGLRIDTVMQVEKDFWNGFRHAAGNTYMLGEINQGDAEFVCGYQGQTNALSGVFDYASYFPLIDAFKSTSGSIPDLVDTIQTVQSSCYDPSLLGTFSENHDVPRFGSLTSDLAAASNVIAYTLLSGGIPVLYQGQEQHYQALGGSNDPYNREALWFSKYNQDAELYKLTQKLNAVRKNAIDRETGYLAARSEVFYHDTTTIGIKKGNLVVVLSNKGSNGDDYTQPLPVNTAPENAQMTELLTCQTVSADSRGRFTVPMGQGAPRIYYPSSEAGSICGGGYGGGSYSGRQRGYAAQLKGRRMGGRD